MKLASSECSPFQIVFFRHTLAMLAFLPFFLLSPKKSVKIKDSFRIILGALCAFTLASLLQVAGVHFSTASDGAFIMAMEPVVTILLAFLILKEQLDQQIFIGLGLALTGFLILSGGSLNNHFLIKEHLIGNAFFLLAVIAEGSLPIFLKPLLKYYSPHVIAFYCLVCASLYTFPFQGGASLATLANIKPLSLIAIAYLGLGGSFLASLLWLMALKHYPVSKVAISWFLQPLFGCLFALFLLKEPLTTHIFFGGCFIVAALVFLIRTPQTKEKTIENPVVGDIEILLRIRHPIWESKPVTPIYATKVSSHKVPLYRKTRRPSLPYLPRRNPQHISLTLH